MKFFYFALLTFGLSFLSSCASVGPGHEESSFVAEERMYGNIPFESISVLKVYPEDIEEDEVKGICFIISTPESFFDLPCENVSFELLNLEGSVVGVSATDSEGRFRFSVRQNKRYRLRVKSLKYRTLSEEIILSSGADTLVRLVKK